MTLRITAQELFDRHREKLALRWLAGQSGGDTKTVVKRVLNAEYVRWAPPLFKRPFHYVVSGLRAMNATMRRYDSLRFGWLGGRGQIPF